MMNKKGEMVLSEIIPIVAMLIFVTGMMYFIYLQENNVLMYEQAYAKEIALIIDSGKPNMTIIIDVSKAKEIALKNKIDPNEIFSYQENKVFVSLNDKGGYEFKVFSDFNVNLSTNGNYLNIILK